MVDWFDLISWLCFVVLGFEEWLPDWSIWSGESWLSRHLHWLLSSRFELCWLSCAICLFEPLLFKDPGCLAGKNSPMHFCLLVVVLCLPPSEVWFFPSMDFCLVLIFFPLVDHLTNLAFACQRASKLSVLTVWNVSSNSMWNWGPTNPVALSRTNAALWVCCCDLLR